MNQAEMFSIVTARLRLRPLEPAWIGRHTRSDVAEEIRHHMAAQAELGLSFWAVENRVTGRLIGDCGLQPLEHRGPEIELGYDFHPAVWGDGIATEAAQAVMRHAHGPLALRRVIAVVKPDHVVSQRVLRKAGLHRAGTRLAYGEPMLLYESVEGDLPQRPPGGPCR